LQTRKLYITVHRLMFSVLNILYAIMKDFLEKVRMAMFEVSQGVSIFMILFATFMWGSWFQCIKRLDNYPVSGFMLWMYTFSFGIVWIFILLFGRFFLSEGILESIRKNFNLALVVVVCGMLFAVGMQINMWVVGKIGIILSVSITSSCNIIFGTFLSSKLGGLKGNISVPLLILAIICLIAASIICQTAGLRRKKDQGEKVKDAAINIKYIFLLVFSNIFFSSSYPIAMSVGVKTDINPSGFEPLLCVALLSSGSLIGTWIYSSYLLTRNRQWKVTFRPKNKSGIVMAFISAVCHYGGNIIHTLAIPQVSMAIAWPMGQSANVWSYLWGLVYREFKGSSKKTYCLLAAGILLFVVGVILLSINIYW